MYGYGGVLFVIEALFVMHAIKRGHGYGWIMLILFFPVVGCMVYFFMVMLHDIRTDKMVAGAASSIARVVNPTRDLKRLMEELEGTNSVTNKTRLASECLSHGMYDKAIELYKDTLSGPFKDDPELLYGLAEAYFHDKQYGNARSILEDMGRSVPKHILTKSRLLYAMTLEASGEMDAALREYESIVPGFIGPEAKCRYGLCLKAAGKHEQAKTVFDDILTTARRSPRSYRKFHKNWLNLAKSHSVQ